MSSNSKVRADRSLQLQIQQLKNTNNTLRVLVDILRGALECARGRMGDGPKSVVFSQAVEEAMRADVNDPESFPVYRITHRVTKSGTTVGIVLESPSFNRRLAFGISPEEAGKGEGYKVEAE